jgi:hypothetical protein
MILGLLSLCGLQLRPRQRQQSSKILNSVPSKFHDRIKKAILSKCPTYSKEVSVKNDHFNLSLQPINHDYDLELILIPFLRSGGNSSFYTTQNVTFFGVPGTDMGWVYLCGRQRSNIGYNSNAKKKKQ